MRFKPRSAHESLRGTHAFLSPSNYHWLNYTLEHLETRLEASRAAERGTKLHEFAEMAISLGQNMPKSKKTLNMFVNDALYHNMTPEQVLYYSPNCYGTADAIGFKRNTLRIFDLKTGVHPASEKQLFVYAALFCLEYGFDPVDIEYDLRIYQNNEIFSYDPGPEIVGEIMDKIIAFDTHIESLKD